MADLMTNTSRAFDAAADCFCFVAACKSVADRCVAEDLPDSAFVAGYFANSTLPRSASKELFGLHRGYLLGPTPTPKKFCNK